MSKRQENYFCRFLHKNELADKKAKTSNSSVRDMFIIERILAKQMVAKYFQIPFEKLQILTGKFGSPYSCLIVDPQKSIGQLSISHTGNILSIAVSKSYLIGIDCQATYQFTGKRFVAAVFTEQEQSQKLLQGNRFNYDEHFTFFWSLKESFVKLLKTGFRGSPSIVKIIEIDFSRGTLAIHYGNKIFNLKFYYVYEHGVCFTNILIAK